MSVSNGDYFILSKANLRVGVDVYYGGSKNGTNIQVSNRNKTTAQIFKIQTRANGSRRIMARYTAKVFDIAGGRITSGTNIQQYTSNETNAQSFDIVETGDTVTVDGTECVEVYIHPSTNHDLAVGLANNAAPSGANVRLENFSETAADQKWVLLPIPVFDSGGIYELRSMLNPTKFCVDVKGGGTTRGTNVQIYAINHSNAQKFYVTNEGNGWSIRNIKSGLYLDVAGGSFKNGTNVQQYTDNNSRAQRWAIASHGETTIDGKKCAILAFGAGNQHNYYMDTVNSNPKNSSNVSIEQVKDYAGKYDQLWALYPTEAEDPNMPIPAKVGAFSYKDLPSKPTSTDRPGYVKVAAQGDNGILDVNWGFRWDCTDAWATDGPNHYQYRYRMRLMNASTSTWREWSSYTPWEEAPVYQYKNQSILEDPINTTINLSENRQVEIDFQVRSVGVDGTANLHGAAQSTSIIVYYIPDIVVNSIGWTPEGLRIGYDSDWTAGLMTFYLKNIQGANGVLVSDEIEFKNMRSSDSILIPNDKLKYVPSDGESITINYTLGTSDYSKFGGTWSETAAVAYDAGSGEDVEPTFERDGIKLYAYIPNLKGTASMYVMSADMIAECGLVETTNTRLKYEVPYPMQTEYSVFSVASNKDGTAWGTDVTRMPAEEYAYHAWSKNGKLIAWLRLNKDEPMYSDRKVDAVYDEYSLLSREFAYVSVSDVKKGTFTATGIADDSNGFPLTEGDLKGVNDKMFMDLLKEKHVLYRSPRGHICDVAITGYSSSGRRDYNEITVEMIQETV